MHELNNRVRILINRDLALEQYTLGSDRGLLYISAIQADTRGVIADILKNRSKRELEVAPRAHTDALGYAIASGHR